MICNCGKRMRFGTFVTGGDLENPKTVLGYTCIKCQIQIILSKGELEDRNLTVCPHCNGTGKTRLFDRPIGYFTKDMGDLFPLLPSMSDETRALDNANPKMIKCIQCDGRGWYEVWDGTN